MILYVNLHARKVRTEEQKQLETTRVTLSGVLFIVKQTQVLACVASVSVGFGSKERDFGVLPARKMGRAPKMKYGGGGGEGRKRLQTNPWILKTSVRQQTELMIDWASRELLTSVHQRS